MEKNETLKLALDYLLKNNYSVIPVGLNKRPLISWKEFQARKATVSEIVSWWGNFPEAQIGIVTGAISDLTVIDIEAGGDFNLVKDNTYMVRTGGGGRHYYFKNEPEIRNSVRVFPLVDTRGEGGYVVAAGSKAQKGVYLPINTSGVSKMLSETKKMFLATKSEQPATLPWYVTDGQDDFSKKAENSSMEYLGSSEGGRNDSMTKFAGSLHAKLHPSLWDSIGWSLFESANMKNVPPLSARELSIIWRSIGSKEQSQNPGGRNYLATRRESSPKTWGPDPDSLNFDQRTALDKKEKEDYSVVNSQDVAKEQALLKNSSDETLETELVDEKESLHVSEVSALQKIDSDHTYPLDMPPFDEALLGGFSAGELIAVAGQPGMGKTTLVQDWSVTLSTGGGGKRESLPCLWFSYEVLAKPLWKKFQAMGADEKTPIYMPRVNDSGEISYVFEVVEKAIEKWGIKVVCIDHLGFLRAPKGNYANAADAITFTVRALKQYAVKKGLIVILPVHMRKTHSKNPTLEDIKDSSGIGQEADTVFFIGRETDSFGLTTNQAKLWLVKNRKTGLAVSGMFDFAFGRYFYVGEDRKDKDKKDAIDTLKDYSGWVK